MLQNSYLLNGTLPTPVNCKFILQLAGLVKCFIEHFLHINNSLEMALHNSPPGNILT